MDRLRVHTEKNHRNAASSGSEERIPMLKSFLQMLRDATFHSNSSIILQAIREPWDIVVNGLTVYNPVLVGAISYVLIPRIYGAFDAFSFLLVFLATILRYIFTYIYSRISCFCRVYFEDILINYKLFS